MRPIETRAGIGCVLFTTALVVAGPVSGQQRDTAFDRHFTDHTMRVDYFHTGGLDQEIVALDRVVADGPWAGSRTQLLDETNLGLYRFELVDPETNRVLYSRGFASIFGEWVTTREARSNHRTFHESLRFPWPKSTVQVVLKRRDADRVFREIWSALIDPDSRFVNAAEVAPMGAVWTIFEHGPASQKVDIVLLGDGYAASELEKFHRDAQRLTDALFATEPFLSRKTDFNVRAVDMPSAQPGVNRPHVGAFRRTPVSTEYNIFDSERYVLTYDNRTLRDVVSAAPYEFVVILVNERQYGGGGIFNAHATVAVDSDFAEYVFVHEFAHHFAGLADEYYTSSVAYETGATVHPEPWEPNVTALHDPATLKWRDLVEPGTPLPTPWEKAAFEEHARAIRDRRQALIDRQAPAAEFDALFREQRETERSLLHSHSYAGKVGAFEGAMYEARGLYRAESDCIMFTRVEFFCRVCRRALTRIIDLYRS